MPRLDTLHLKIITGQNGPGHTPRYEINSFEIDFDEVNGGTGPGETVELTGSPQSFPHSLAILGPDEGRWDIEKIEATFHTGDEPYTIRLGTATLDGETKLNLKYDRQPVLLDV